VLYQVQVIIPYHKNHISSVKVIDSLPNSTGFIIWGVFLSDNQGLFQRHRNLIFFLIGLIVTFAILYALRSAIFPFIIGIIIAYLVHPLINWIETKLPYKGKYHQTKRIVLIFLIFILVIALIGLFIFYIISEVADSFIVLIQNAPSYITGAWKTIEGWLDSFRYSIPEEWQQELNNYIKEIGGKASGTIQQGVMSALEFIPTTVNFVLAFISLPIFLFFILKDTDKLKEGFYSYLTPGVAIHTHNVINIVENILGRYIRAQLFLGLVVATLVFIGLSVLRIKLAAPLAVVAGITELIPILGPWLGAAVGVLIALATAPDKVIWVAVVYLAVQQVENIFLVPRIQGGLLHINPAILMVLIVLGSYIAGIWGIILIAPLTATIVEIYKYVRTNNYDEVTEVSSQNVSENVPNE
jgi:predicted PurR-regulated permease PerM